MLAFFRKKKNQFIVKGIMILLGVSFVFLGFTGYMAGYHSSQEIARTKNTSIDSAQFENMVKTSVDQMRTYSPTFDSKMLLTNPAFFQSFTQQAFYNLLIESYAKDRDFVMTDKQAYKIIANIPDFQDQTKKFNYSAFKEMISRAGYSEKSFVDKVKKDSQLKLANQLLSLPSIIPNSYILMNHKFANEKREVEFTSIKPENFKIFTMPTDDELKSTYEMNKHDFQTPTEKTISYITLKDADKAEEILDEIIGGTKIEDIAKTNNLNFKRENVVFGGKIDDDIIAKNIDMLKNLTQGEESDIITYKDENVIFFCETSVNSAPIPLEKLKTEMTSIWKAEQQRAKAYIALNAALKDINSGKSFKEAVSGNGLKPETKTFSKIDLDNISEKMTLDEADLKQAETEIFKAPINKAIIIKGTNEYFLARSVKQEFVEITDKKDLADSEYKLSSKEFQNNLFDEQTHYLQNYYRFRVNQDAIKDYIRRYK